LVLVVETDAGRAAAVEEGLTDANAKVVTMLDTDVDIHARVRDLRPDIVMVCCARPGRDILENMHEISATNPRPIILFVDESDEEMTKEAVNAGVAAYVVDGLKPSRIAPLMDIAILRFQLFQGLRLELKDSKEKLAARKVIDRAKGILMKNQQISEDEAYRRLRDKAMRESKPLSEIAEQVISVSRLLNS
jgi:response regulator NasT